MTSKNINVLNLDKVTAKEVVDYVKNHLVNQKVPSLYHRRCRYRGLNNTKCAAGILIPDNLYRPSMEGRSWGNVVAEWGFPRAHVEVVTMIQKAHDRAAVFNVENGEYMEALLNGLNAVEALYV